ncbi:MAG: inorganic phosphate transporter [Terracidiphilus sp.]
MADLVATQVLAEPATLLDRKLTRRPSRVGLAVFLAALAVSLGYIAIHVARDLAPVQIDGHSAFILLAFTLAIALGFEFVNGFHDTANAVATVIYTHSMEPRLAVVWSGICNLAGVLLSTGAVAYAVIALLPVELILKISSGAGFSMVLALLVAAILWNLGTWWFGLPASSSHTLVGSIIGVGLMNQWLNPHGGASGLDWDQAIKVLKALLISPIVGFTLAGLLVLLSKWTFRYPALYEAPKDNQPPPWPIRALMVLTCTGVSFFHGSNDGQKGMGLIMLILIGTVPAAYALNHGLTPEEIRQFLSNSAQVEHILDRKAGAAGTPTADPHAALAEYVRTRQLAPDTVADLKLVVLDLDREIARYNGVRGIPAQDQTRVRNEMYVASETLRLMDKAYAPAFTPSERSTLRSYRGSLDKSTKFIPTWVKVAVALALGLGTMVGWKRIVITVGERIGKEHLTYAQGAAAGLVAMGTIFAADNFGLPVSTTHILSSGVAGTMAANGSGLRLSTIRNIAAGWVFTLPAAALLSGLLYWIFRFIA